MGEYFELTTTRQCPRCYGDVLLRIRFVDFPWEHLQIRNRSDSFSWWGRDLNKFLQSVCMDRKTLFGIDMAWLIATGLSLFRRTQQQEEEYLVDWIKKVTEDTPEGDLEETLKQIEDINAPVQGDEEGNTVAMIAAMQGKTNLVEILVKKRGADLKLTNRSGRIIYVR